MRFTSTSGVEIEVVQEPFHLFGGRAGERTYAQEHRLGDKRLIAVARGVHIDGEGVMVLGGDRPGRLGTHAAMVRGDLLQVLVGRHVVTINVVSRRIVWTTEVDPVACFGIHLAPEHDALIAHGELAVSRLADDGSVLWSAEGEDFLTGDLSLERDHVAVSDCEGRMYHFAYGDGQAV